MKVNIDIPEDMLEAIDGACKREYFSRSEWIRTAIRSKLFTPPEGIHSRQEGITLLADASEVLEEHISTTLKNSTVPENIPLNIKNRWCELHFERGVTYDCTLISWEDENGDMRVNKKWACPKCFEKYRTLPVGTFYEHYQI